MMPDTWSVPYPTIRFALGDPKGMSSLSWRVWVTPAGDAYIGCRDNYQVLKVSLHRSGRWRMGLTADGAAATAHLRPPGADRAWDVWDRPDAVGGVTIGYRILFLPSESVVTPALRQSLDWKKVEFLSVPMSGYITVATVSINDPDVQMLVDGAADQAAGFLDMPDGKRLQLTLHTEVLGEDFRCAIAAGFQQGLALMRAAEVVAPSEGRMIITGTRGDARFAVEARVGRPDPDPLRLLGAVVPATGRSGPAEEMT
jgi:hypothetical protein